MMARSRRGDTRFRGEQTRRQRAAVQERQQNLCAGRLGEQRPDSREIGLTHRLLLLAHQCADPSARTFRSKSKHLRAMLISKGSLQRTWITRTARQPLHLDLEPTRL